jgi:hypothetical protein
MRSPTGDHPHIKHESTQMTAHYARITDQTVRRRWEQATKVNIKGERVSIDPDEPLAQAQWAKTRYGLATQTLPHGYCGLPVQKSCPHANACFSELSSHRAEDFPEMDPNEGMLSSVAAAFRWSVASIWASLSLTPL